VDPCFTGRDAELDDLHARLVKTRQAGAPPVGLTGVRGIGKTQMAAKYRQHYWDYYHGHIYWVDGTNGIEHALEQLGGNVRSDLETKPQKIRAARNEDAG